MINQDSIDYSNEKSRDKEPTEIWVEGKNSSEVDQWITNILKKYFSGQGSKNKYRFQ